LLNRPSRRSFFRTVGGAMLATAVSSLPAPGLVATAAAATGGGTAFTFGGAAAGHSDALPSMTWPQDVPDRMEFLGPADTAIDTPAILARVRLFGDMHFGYTGTARLDAVAADLAQLPPPDALLSTGDETHFGTPDEYAAAVAWLAQWNRPFFTVTGNHTFWNASERHRETSAGLYQRFQQTWGQAMPYSWEIGGLRFVATGPTEAGTTPTGASITAEQVDELAAMLSQAPTQPTVVVLHSPLHHTVLGDGGPANSVYTSDDFGFYQTHSDRIRAVLADAPQVALVITGHTHSPLRARGLLSLVPTADHLVPQFNAMALPFVRREVLHAPPCQQDLVTWELAISRNSILVTGRDHLAQQDVARVVLPLPANLPGTAPAGQRL
jgi:predicted MPP superfamily phosphohydrolase